MCDGDDVAAAFVTATSWSAKLLGSVPDDAPPVPLDADLRARARALKLKIDPLDEDPRAGPAQGDRPGPLGVPAPAWRAAHRLGHGDRGPGQRHGHVPRDVVAALAARAGGRHHRRRASGARRWTTAASARVVGRGGDRGRAGGGHRASSGCCWPTCPSALGPVLRALDARAAADSDVRDLMAAVPALVRAIRYGDVRGTDTGALAAVVDALAVRVCAGLPAAVGGLADDAATALRSALDGMHAALGVCTRRAARRREPHGSPVAGGACPARGRRDVHGLVAGRVVRLLADAGLLPWPEAATRLRAALSVGVPAAGKARVGGGVPVRRRPAARPRPGSARASWTAGWPPCRRRGVPGRAAAAAADVRRVLRAGAGLASAAPCGNCPAGHGGGPPGARAGAARCRTTSTPTGRRRRCARSP